MKTAKQLIDEYNPLNARPDVAYMIIETLMKVYAEQAIDLASERAIIKFIPYEEGKLQPELEDWDLSNDGQWFILDKESITNIKKELK